MKNRSEKSNNLPVVAEKVVEAPEIAGAVELDESLKSLTLRALEEVAEMERKASTIAKGNPDLRGRAIALRERAKKLGKQIKKTVEYATLLISLALAADFADQKLTRYHVDEKFDKRGKIVFQHQDEETTKILEYLSGKADLPEKDRHGFEVEMVRGLIRSNNLTLPKNLEEMSEGKLSEFWDNTWRKLLKQHDLSYSVGGELERMMPARYQESEKLYEALWRIEKQAGNPRVRFKEFSPRKSLSVALRIKHEDAYYDPVTNTTYISYPMPMYAYIENLPEADPEVVDEFVAESAHGKQRARGTLTAVSGIKDAAPVLVDILRHAKSPNEAYKETLYNKPGSIEYEAHKQIEPELRKELYDYETEQRKKNLEVGKF